MRFEVGFVAGYAGVLLLAALGLHRLGRVNSSPWASRLLAGYRRQLPVVPSAEVGAPLGWPHVGARRLHTGMAVVAAVAAVLLAGAEVVRHHRPLEVLVLAGVMVLGSVVVARLAVALRPAG